MTCCTITITPFVSEAITTIPYTGERPTVTVSYLIEGVWQVFVGSVVKLLPGSVVVDHGGLSTGVVKLIDE